MVRRLLPTIALVLLSATPAQGAVDLGGTTATGGPVEVTVTAGGRVTRAVVAWEAVCRSGAALRDIAFTRPPRRASTPEAFTVAGSYRLLARGGRRVTVAVRIAGQLAEPGRWTGAVTGAVTVRRRGRVTDRCTIAPNTWRAAAYPALAGAPFWKPGGPGAAPAVAPSPPPASSAPSSSPPSNSSPPPSGSSPQQPPPPPEANPEPRAGPWSLEMRSDSGDYVGAGESWSHGPPEDDLKVTAYRNGLSFHLTTDQSYGWWGGRFEAPEGENLTTKRYTGAQRFSGPGHAGLDVSGMGRGCNQQAGEFTVHELEFDSAGTLRHIRVTFEQHCEGAEPALRGTFEFSAA